MSSLNSLSELLEESKVQFRFYDMGRQISAVTSEEFTLIEKGERVYPRPYLHQAWVALALWDPVKTEQSVVWFLKFPLDEQGYLVQAVRDDFINRLMLNIHQILESQEISEAEDALKDNPFSFTPDQEKMAMFHAVIAAQTNSPKSQYYDLCLAYFSGKLAWERWQELGLQGIADIAVNLDENGTQASLIEHFNDYPQAPLIALCHHLEHVSISDQLAQKILTRLTDNLQHSNPDINLCAALIRALHAANDEDIKQQGVLLLLRSSLGTSAEILTTIGVKLPNQLHEATTISLFLENLAISEAGQQGFSRLLADLMFSEDLRVVILSAFRNPERSDNLTRAIGSMFGGRF